MTRKERGRSWLSIAAAPVRILVLCALAACWAVGTIIGRLRAAAIARNSTDSRRSDRNRRRTSIDRLARDAYSHSQPIRERRQS